MTSSSLTRERRSHITVALGSARWDAWLSDSPEGFYSSPGWLQLMQDTEGYRDELHVATDDDDELAAILPVAVAAEGPTNPLYDLAQLTRSDAASAEPGTTPQTLLGPHAGYANQPLVRSPAYLPEWGELVRKALNLADGDWVGIPFLRLDAARPLRSALPDHQLVLTEGRCEIPVAFDSFDGYLSGLSRSRRSQVRRDIRAFEAGGGRVVVSELRQDMAAELAPLLQAVQHQHGSLVDLDTVTGFLTATARSSLASDTVVFAVRKAGRLVAFSLCFRFRETLVLRVVGLDYENVRQHREYFTVLVYAPLRYCCEQSLTTYDLGTKGYRAKLMRGAHYVPQVTALLRVPASVTGEHVRHANRAAATHMAEELGDLLDVTASIGTDSSDGWTGDLP